MKRFQLWYNWFFIIDKLDSDSLEDKDTVNTEEKEIEDKSQEDEQDGESRGTKRRASIAFSEAGDEEFKGFEETKDQDLSKEYSRVLGEFLTKFVLLRVESYNIWLYVTVSPHLNSELR